jgi:Holliday junction DNA helicase RuvA
VIASVSGRVAALTGDTAVVEVGGFGVAVLCTPAVLASLRPGEPTTLATSLVVREDSLTLYGFADSDERSVFEIVQTVSGVGPRLAQAMLAVHSPDALRRAVMTEDLVALMKVSGVGRKGAQRIVLELKDRLGPPLGGASSTPAGGRPHSGGPEWQGQVHAGLMGLGWSARDADEAVQEVAPEAAAMDGPADVAALLRSALRSLSRA